MATQKEKIIKAMIMAQTIKNIASRLEYDAKDFGVQFPRSYAKELRELAEDYLKTK